MAIMQYEDGVLHFLVERFKYNVDYGYHAYIFTRNEIEFSYFFDKIMSLLKDFPVFIRSNKDTITIQSADRQVMLICEKETYYRLGLRSNIVIASADYPEDDFNDIFCPLCNMPLYDGVFRYDKEDLI